MLLLLPKNDTQLEVLLDVPEASWWFWRQTRVGLAAADQRWF